MADNAVRIDGLRELERAFRDYGRGLEKGVNEALEAAAAPVHSEAQALAVVALKPVKNVDWTRMRVGVTRRTAYIVPQQRGRGTPSNRRRPNLKERLLGLAMEPALAANVGAVEDEFEEALNDLAKRWSRI